MRTAILDFLQYGLPYVYPQQPGALVRGVATAHSAPPLNELIETQEVYVWQYGKGDLRGQSIEPLHPNVPEALMETGKTTSSFLFKNTKKGVNAFIRLLKNKNISLEKTLSCMEHTGVYGRLIIAKLLEK